MSDSLEKRLETLENESDRPSGEAVNKFGGEDVLILIQHYRTILTADGSQRIAVPAKYPEPRPWDEIEPEKNGDRIQVLRPCSKNPNEAAEAKA